MTNKQRRKYLHELVEYIAHQEDAGDGQFSISDWHSGGRGNGQFETPEACGTTHCIAGWAQIRSGELSESVYRWRAIDEFAHQLETSPYGTIQALTFFERWELENRRLYDTGDKLTALLKQIDHVTRPDAVWHEPVEE